MTEGGGGLKKSEFAWRYLGMTTVGQPIKMSYGNVDIKLLHILDSYRDT